MNRRRVINYLTTLSFLLPALLLVGVFIVWPTVETLRLSFYSDEGFVGLRNFQDILSSRSTLNLERFPGSTPPWGSLVHNAVWILVHLPVTVILGIILAVLFSKVQGWWVNVIKMTIFLGMVTPLVVGGVIIRFLFDRGAGVVPATAAALGLDNFAKTWTAYPDTALLALIIGSIWLWTGFSMVLHSAGLSTIDRELYEAAELDGANEWHKFWMITIPLLWPVTAVVIALTVLWELKIFDIVYVATMGGPGGSSMVLALQMYILGFRELNPYSAATVATLLTVLSLPVGIWIARRSLRG